MLYRIILTIFITFFSIYANANLIRTTISFSADNFTTPFNSAQPTPPISDVSGSLSFLMPDPTSVATTGFVIEFGNIPIALDLEINGVRYLAENTLLQYRIFNNMFNSFSIGAVIGPLDSDIVITVGTDDFWISTVNGASNFAYSVNGVNEFFESTSLQYTASFASVPVPEPGTFSLFALVLLIVNIKRKKISFL